MHAAQQVLANEIAEKFAIAFSNRLRELRKRIGLNQDELAARAGVSTPTLRSWEKGEHLPKIDGALKLAAALDLGSIEELFGSVSPSGEFLAEARHDRPESVPGAAA